MSKVLVIAEAGINHNGSIEIAERLIEKAAYAGADFVKFQSFRADQLVTKTASKAEYQIQNTISKETQFEMIQKLELSKPMHLSLVNKCKDAGIAFASTAFDKDSIDHLINVGVKFLKVPSGEITNLPLLRHAGSKGLPIFLSTGMSDMKEVEIAVDILESSGTKRDDLVVLQCNTEYPTPPKDVNLRTMLSIKDRLGVDIGYSDHTMGIEVAIAAVAMGATVIEKHFTLDRRMDGPDHTASLEPNELKEMVSCIRNIEMALGDGIKKPSASEKKNIKIARRSIVAKKRISKGEVFSSDNLTVKRPGTGISPLRWDYIMGTKSHRDYLEDDFIELS